MQALVLDVPVSCHSARWNATFHFRHGLVNILEGN
jgi:hypothetical protein